MARTLAEINREIAALQREAEVVRPKEIGEVIRKIKEAITFYGLTTEDLFGGTRAGRKARKMSQSEHPAPRKERSSAGNVAAKPVSVPKYRDPATGKTWTGNGKRPRWFVEALASGKKAEELAI